MLVRVIDFETTGFPPDCAIVEVGWSDVWATDEDVSIDPPVSRYCNPGRTIPPEARAVHHISDLDVRVAVSPDEALRDLNDKDVDVWCAHNAAFERQLFDGAGKPWICTLKSAYRIWPDAPNHQNQTLRYYRGIECDPAMAMPPHRAGPDAFVTAKILAHMLEDYTVEQLIEWSNSPSLLPSIRFGKHRGKKWNEVPPDYLEWIGRQSDMDADVKFTANHYLRKLETSP